MLYLLVGLPGAGKTTRARELEAGHRALRLTPDEWMSPLFGESDAGGKRDVLEGRLIWVGLRVLAVGTSVVLDFGFWGRDERSSLRSMAQTIGVDCEVVYLAVDRETQQQRIRRRYQDTPAVTFDITAADLDVYRAQFEEPRADELDGSSLEPPPPGWSSWSDWASTRWPSLPRLGAP